MSTIRSCQAPECGRTFYVEGNGDHEWPRESPDHPGYCETCGEEVVAFLPNGDKDDEWFFLVNKGSFVEDVFNVPNSDQCGECGGSFYRAYANDTAPGISVFCVEGDYGDGIIVGCGSAKPVSVMPTYKVIF